MTDHTYTLAPQLSDNLKRYQHLATFVALIFLALTAVGFFVAGAQQFLRSYLIGFFFWTGMGLGCLALMMIQYLSGGAWGIVIRRPLEAGSRTLYVMLLLFIPLALGVHVLYEWADPAKAAVDKIIQAKRAYLNVPFFWLRWIIYGAVWLGLTFLLNKWSLQEDETGSPEYSKKLEALSGPGLVAYVLTITLASVDWIMSLDPRWFSTIFGFLVAIGQTLSAMAFTIAILVVLAQYPPLDHAITKRHLHDLGKLLLTFVMLWAYLSFSQLVIIWSGNLPEEITWYINRLNGGWQWIGLVLLLFHFALPFVVLLSQSIKRNPRTIFWVAIWVIAVRLVDVFWLVEPNFTGAKFHLHWLDIAAPIGIGGLWLALFFWNLPQRPLLPVRAPDLEKALNHGRNH